EDLLQDAARWAWHLGVDLVRGDLEERLVGGDRLALGLEPLRDRSLGDGHAHLGHDDVDCGSRGGHQYSASSLTPATTSSTCGMKDFSSGGENGTGVSGAAMRLTGASRFSKASSPIVAAISAPKPPVCVSSWRTSAFDVFSNEASTFSLSQGAHARRSRLCT